MFIQDVAIAYPCCRTSVTRSAPWASAQSGPRKIRFNIEETSWTTGQAVTIHRSSKTKDMNSRLGVLRQDENRSRESTVH